MTAKLLPPLSSELTFQVAETLAELRAIRRFRKVTYRRRSGLIINDGLAVDRRSIVFGLLRGRRPVASLRLLPLPDAAAGIHDFAGAASDPTFGADVELGRLAVAADESPTILLNLVHTAALWLAENSLLDSYVSFCNPKLRFGYELFGAVDRGVDAVHPDTGRPYRLLTGRFEDALPKSAADAIPTAA